MDRCEVPCISEVIGDGAEAHRLARVGSVELSLYVAEDGEDRIPARDLAKPLGYARERKFFELVRKLERERPDFGRVLSRPTAGRGLFRGKSQEATIVEEPMLTERQAILAAISSDTDQGWKVKVMLVEVFLALRNLGARHGLPMPDVRQLIARQDRLEAENADLLARMALMDPIGPGVIGKLRAERYILDQLREAARLACTVSGDATRTTYLREFKERENELRTHVCFPSARGYRWESLPIADFGKAQTKVIQILERERHRSKRILAEVSKRLKQIEMGM